MIDKSNWVWDKRNNEELRDKLKIRKTLLNDSNKKMPRTSQMVMRILAVLYNGWKHKDLNKITEINNSIKEAFVSNEYISFFKANNYNDVFVSFNAPKHFLKVKNPTENVQDKTLDFYATYLGYAGVLGMLNKPPISLARCFFLEEFGIDTLLVLIKKEAKNITDTNSDIQEAKQKKFRELTEDDIVKYLLYQKGNQKNELVQDILAKELKKLEEGLLIKLKEIIVSFSSSDKNSLNNQEINGKQTIIGFLESEISEEKGEIIRLKEITLQLLKKEKNNEAIGVYNKLISLDDKNPKTWYVLGNLCRNERRFLDAIKAFTKCINLKKNEAIYHFSLGGVYVLINEHKKAKNSIKQAIKLMPNNSDWLFVLWFSYLRANRYKKAIKTIKKAIELNKNKELYYIALIQSYIITNGTKQALGKLKDVKVLNDKNSLLWFIESYLYAIQGMIKEAIEAIKKAIELNTTNARYSAFLKILLNAKDAYNLKKTENSNLSEDEINLAIYNTTGTQSYNELIEIANKNIKAFPNDPLVWLSLGAIHLDKKQYNKAFKAYKKVIELDSKNILGLTGLGSIYIEFGNYKKSISEFKKLVSVAPKTMAHWYLLGNAQAMDEQYTEAIPNFKKALEFDSRNIEIINSISYCQLNLANQGKKKQLYVETILSLKNSLNIDNANVMGMRMIGWGYLMLGDILESKIWYANSIKIMKHKVAYTSLGHCELILEDKKEAIENYKKGLDLWNCSEEFFKDFDNDFQYIQTHRISKDDYDKIKEELREYCDNKKK